MINRTFLLILFIQLIVGGAVAQRLSPEAYIEQYKDIAIREMKRMGVPASIILAQGLLETENGNSVLVKKSNNHFGIKCKSNWTAASVSHDDDAPGECFRVYSNADESFRDHSNFLRAGQRYSFLFNYQVTDYKAWAHGLKRAGYATNPKYPAILIRHIEQYNLQQYTLEGISGNTELATLNPEAEKITFDKNHTIEPAVADNLAAPAAVEEAPAEVAISATQPGVTFQPGKAIIINGSKCIYALKGTSLLAIASIHRLSLKKLLDINELEDDGLLEEDQLVYLQKKSRMGAQEATVVPHSTTLYHVAQLNGVQLEYLLEYNQRQEDGDIAAGSTVYLKPPKEIAKLSIPASSGNKTKMVMYEVQPKDGLYAVARKHGVTVEQLKEWNNLTSDNLQVGQQLIVSR